VVLLREGETGLQNQKNMSGMRDMEVAENVRVKLNKVGDKMQFSRSMTRGSSVLVKNELRGHFRRLVSQTRDGTSER
jgi:hypothetical protein